MIAVRMETILRGKIKDNIYFVSIRSKKKYRERERLKSVFSSRVTVVFLFYNIHKTRSTM